MCITRLKSLSFYFTCLALGWFANFADARPTTYQQGFGIGSLLNREGTRLFPQFVVFPRHPGKPDLRWRTFGWKYTDLERDQAKFRLYFYDEETWTAKYAVPRISSQLSELIKLFKFTPKTSFNYLLFSSQRDFQQANIFYISEGVQGVTSTTEATMAIPYWGEAETFRHISMHEMTHQLQVQKTFGSGQSSAGGNMEVIPLWLIEGMAEYYSLHGIDPETRVYVRDLLLHPKKDEDYKIPDFFQDGAYDFVHVYKLGQVKNAFLETFGVGTIQRVLDTAASTGYRVQTFQQLLSKLLNLPPDIIEKKWRQYIDDEFKTDADQYSQTLDGLETVPNTNENLDLFTVSPSGDLIAVREIDPLVGVTSIHLLDAKNGYKKIEVIHDRQADILSLYFFQRPGLALSDHLVAFIAEAVTGPQLIVRELERDQEGRLRLGKTTTIRLFEHAITQASAPTISPDETQLAFVGLNSQGWQNVYVTSVRPDQGKRVIHRLTDSFYSWRTLYWNKAGIVASSDQTPGTQYNLFRLDPQTGQVERLTKSLFNQTAPWGSDSDLLFQSWQSGTSQIHRLSEGKEIRLTDFKTQMLSPQMRNGELYSLGFRSGRFHLYRIPKEKIKGIPIRSTVDSFGTSEPWRPTFQEFKSEEVHSYKPFVSSGIRMDFLSAFLGSGSFGGATAAFSDLMRNYSVLAEFATFGGIKNTSVYGFLTSEIGRTNWTLGAYRVLQPTLDNIYSSQDLIVRTYTRREFGVLGAIQYPLGAFNFMDVELRVAGVNRTDFSDGVLVDAWNAQNPGREFLLTPILRYGYDSILYELFSGPLRGFGAIVESGTSYFPDRGAWTQRMRFDVSQYWSAFGRTVFALQGMLGASWGDRYNDSFLISGDDVMRAYSFGDDRLYGNYYMIGNFEARFPIGSLFKFDPLRGVVAADIGSIFIAGRDIGKRVASSYSFGLLMNIPPLSLNFILSYPVREAPGIHHGSVFHFALKYLYG